jgi:hypothetical protein
VIGLRLFLAALLVSFAFVALGGAWWESSQRAPGHVRSEGAQPGDYRPVASAEHESPSMVSELEERCLEDTNYFGWAQTSHGGTMSVVSCWSGKPRQSLELWERVVYVGP